MKITTSFLRFWAFNASLFVGFNTNAQTTTPTPAQPIRIGRIKFEETKYNFGTVKEDSIVEHQFKFKNTGNAPLKIFSALANCGCTIAYPPTQAIERGEEGTILVRFDAINRFGPQKKTIMVKTNGIPERLVLTIEGWVEQIPGGVKR